jgi:hypothetical protein
MKSSREDVVSAYKLFLDRMPESEEIITYWDGHDTKELLIAFMRSEEYRQKSYSMFPQHSNVIINDFIYNPVIRPTFCQSRISKIIRRDYENNIELYKRKVSAIKKYSSFLTKILKNNPEYPEDPVWENDFIPPIDGAFLYTTLVEKNPRWYVECGSGNTTKFASRAIRDHRLKTKILSIDPFPRAEVDNLCDKIFRIPFEEMDLSFFDELTSEDILLIDNSHRAFPNSDVTVFFTEILPELPRGMLYTIHDIALPYEVFSERWYNEQYMLAVYLLGGGNGDKIYFPTAFLSQNTNLLRKLHVDIPIYPGASFEHSPGFFWMEKGSS